MSFKKYLLERNIREAKLTKADLAKQDIRYDNFKNKLKNGEPFEGNKGEYFILDKGFKLPLSSMDLPDILPLEGGDTVRLSSLKKTVEFGSTGGKSDAVSTGQQERASLYAIEMGMTNSFSDFNDFYNKTKDEISKIYPDISEHWFNVSSNLR